MRFVFIAVACFFIGVYAEAQPYVNNKTRHRFAQLNLGIDTRVYFGHNARSFYLDAQGEKKERTLGNQTETRLLIGGTHFWGHADFQVAVPVLSKGSSGFFTSV